MAWDAWWVQLLVLVGLLGSFVLGGAIGSYFDPDSGFIVVGSALLAGFLAMMLLITVRP